jgi:hypothetical protein
VSAAKALVIAMNAKDEVQDVEEEGSELAKQASAESTQAGLNNNLPLMNPDISTSHSRFFHPHHYRYHHHHHRRRRQRRD